MRRPRHERPRAGLQLVCHRLLRASLRRRLPAPRSTLTAVACMQHSLDLPVADEAAYLRHPLLRSLSRRPFRGYPVDHPPAPSTLQRAAPTLSAHELHHSFHIGWPERSPNQELALSAARPACLPPARPLTWLSVAPQPHVAGPYSRPHRMLCCSVRMHARQKSEYRRFRTCFGPRMKDRRLESHRSYCYIRLIHSAHQRNRSDRKGN